MKDAIQELSSIEALEANWDGEGASKPSVVAVENVRKFLETLIALGEPSIGPCADGSIDVFWKGEDHILVNFTHQESIAFSISLCGYKTSGSKQKGK